MGDLAATIIAKSDQLNADDLVGGPITIVVTDAVVNSGDQPLSIFYEGHNGKPYKPSKGMRRLMMMAWDTDESKDIIGKTMTLYRDPTVLWAGQPEGGIRISHLSHIDEELTFPIMVKRGKRERITVKPLPNGAARSFTIDDARHRLSTAQTLDDLRTIWSGKIMAPFREELAGYLDERKAALSEPEQGRTDEQHGDQNDGDEVEVWRPMVDDWLERIARADMVGTIISVRSELEPHRDVLPDEVVADLDRALTEAAAKFTTGE